MKYSKILIIRLSAAGDIVLTFPAYSFLRQAFPDAVIDWAVDERFSGLIDLMPNLGRKIIFPGKTLKNKNISLLDKIRSMLTFIKEIRRERYDLIIDFQGLFKSGIISFLSRGGIKAGFAPGGHDSREMSHIFKNRIIKFNDSEACEELKDKILYRSLYLASKASEIDLIIPDVKINFCDSGTKKAVEFYEKIELKQHLAKKIILNPFTNWVTKTWPIENWIELIKIARSDEKLKNTGFIIMWGPAEKALAEKIVSCDNMSFMAPDTTFNEAFSILDGADAVVSGDSFALHASFILKKKTIALFGASEPARCAPFGGNSITISAGLECQHCFKKTCRFNTEECIRKIAPQNVLNALKELV